MNKANLRQHRILAIAPSTRGFGFAILEGQDTLADWGVKTITGDKNTNAVTKVKELVTHYRPDVMVLEDTGTKDSGRSPRIQALTRRILIVAKARKIWAALFSQKEMRRIFFAGGRGTKHALAEILARRFPEELASRLPPKRRPWMSEDYRVDIFNAVALAVALRLKRPKRTDYHAGRLRNRPGESSRVLSAFPRRSNE